VPHTAISSTVADKPRTQQQPPAHITHCTVVILLHQQPGWTDVPVYASLAGEHGGNLSKSQHTSSETPIHGTRGNATRATIEPAALPAQPGLGTVPVPLHAVQYSVTVQLYLAGVEYRLLQLSLACPFTTTATTTSHCAINQGQVYALLAGIAAAVGTTQQQ
jgi:hypothetical protein